MSSSGSGRIAPTGTYSTGTFSSRFLVRCPVPIAVPVACLKG
jgi:hypothetical protein